MDGAMNKIKEDLCNSLKYYAEQGLNNSGDIETVKHILSGLYKIKVMQAMDAYHDGYSGRYYMDDGSSYRRGADGRYMDGGSSYRMHSRGYHDDGREGYSNRGDMHDKLARMLDNTQDGHEREIIQKIMHAI